MWAYLDGTERPRSPRVRTSIAATLLTDEDTQMPVEVTDLSSGGFRLRARGELKPGQQVRLRVSRYGDFLARIHWTDEGEAGGTFLEPVTL